MDKSDRVEILLESLSERFDVMAEGIGVIQDDLDKLRTVPESLVAINNRLEILESGQYIARDMLFGHDADIAVLKTQAHFHG